LSADIGQPSRLATSRAEHKGSLLGRRSGPVIGPDLASSYPPLLADAA
jgi:hypothetical protein